jgi:predicted DNA-binding protein
MNIVLPEKMSERLKEVSKRTGLSKSEIGRRGILEQLEELEGDSA